MNDILPNENLVLEAINDIRRNDSMKKQMLYIYTHGNNREKRMVLKALKEYTDCEEQYEEYKTEKEWKEFYTMPRFQPQTEDTIFNIYINLKCGVDISTTPTTIKGEIISYQEFDSVAMEVIAKQKLKLIWLLGYKQEKVFVTKMVKSYIKNKKFSIEEEKEINEEYNNINNQSKLSR